jgi:hypothetical protein
MSRAAVLIAAAACVVAGCPVEPGALDGSVAVLIPTDFDGAWRITSETGLVNRCVTILGDRVTQFSECDGRLTLISDADLGARSGDQVIWTFRTSDDSGETVHTVSVREQTDGTLRGTYSLRLPDSVFALTDRIIMERRRIRV